MISFICEIYNRKETNEQTKQNKFIDTKDWWLPEGKKTWGRVKWVKAMKCSVTDGSQTLGSEHTTLYTDIL